MQKNLRNMNIRSQSYMSSQHIGEIGHFDGILAARIFTWYRTWQNPHRKTIPPFKLIKGTTLYKAHKDALNKFAKMANDNNFDISPYFKYCVIDRGINEDCIDACLSSTVMMDEYKLHLKKQKKLDDIYEHFIRTLKNIVNECLATQTYTTKDYLRWLVDNNKIGTYVLAGKISMHYLAAIPSFNKVIEHLDYFSKLELTQLNDHFEIYHSEINEAFLAKKKKMVNPIKLTDLAILKALKKL